MSHSTNGSYGVQERVLSAIEGRTLPDRVPVFIPRVEDAFARRFRAARNIDGRKNKCPCNGMDLSVISMVGADCCTIPGPPHDTSDLQLPELDDGNHLDIFGRIFKHVRVGDTISEVYMGPFLTTDEKIREWDFINPLPVIEGWDSRIYQEIIRAVDEFQVCPVFNATDGLYTLLEQSMGVKSTAYFLHDYPDLVDMQLGKIFKVIYHDVKEILRAGGAFIMIRDNIVVNNRPTITPSLVKSFLLKYYKQLVSEIHHFGGKAFFYTDGDVLTVLDTIIDAGFDVIHVAKPGYWYMEDVIRAIAGRACVSGNLDVDSVLLQGSPVQVRKSVTQLVELGKRVGRYIFGLNRAIKGNTNMSNVEEMTATLRKGTPYK